MVDLDIVQKVIDDAISKSYFLIVNFDKLEEENRKNNENGNNIHIFINDAQAY